MNEDDLNRDMDEYRTLDKDGKILKLKAYLNRYKEFEESEDVDSSIWAMEAILTGVAEL